MRRFLGKGLEGALFRYQVMANIVGVLIIPLFVFTGLHYIQGGGYKIELAIFGVGHGYLYIVYLVMAGLLALKARSCHLPLDPPHVRRRPRTGAHVPRRVDHRDQEGPSPHGGPPGRGRRASRRGQPSRSMTVPLAWPPPSHIVW